MRRMKAIFAWLSLAVFLANKFPFANGQPLEPAEIGKMFVAEVSLPDCLSFLLPLLVIFVFS